MKTQHGIVLLVLFSYLIASCGSTSKAPRSIDTSVPNYPGSAGGLIPQQDSSSLTDVPTSLTPGVTASDLSALRDEFQSTLADVNKQGGKPDPEFLGVMSKLYDQIKRGKDKQKKLVDFFKMLLLLLMMQNCNRQAEGLPPIIINIPAPPPPQEKKKDKKSIGVPRQVQAAPSPSPTPQPGHGNSGGGGIQKCESQALMMLPLLDKLSKDVDEEGVDKVQNQVLGPQQGATR